MRRIAAIARNTFREAVRNKILYSLLFFALALIGSATAVAQLTLHEEVRMIRDLGLYGVDIFGVIIAIFLGVNLLYKELDLKTVYTILPKPIRRWEFVLGKWLGMLLTLWVQVLVMGAVLLVLLASFGAGLDVATLKAILLLFGNLMVVTSIAVFFSAFSSPFLSGFFALGIFVLGRSVPDIKALGASAVGDAQAGATAILDVVTTLLPNLHLFYPSGTIIGAQSVSVHREFVGASYLFSTSLYAFGYSVAVLILAMLIFRRRDFV